MIYGASLGPFIKKALQDKAFQTSVDKITDKLTLAPDVSGMDAVILGPRDLAGAAGKALWQAMAGKHPAVRVLYVYRDEKEAGLLDGDVIKAQSAKVTPEHIRELVEGAMEMAAIRADDRIVQSADGQAAERTGAAPEAYAPSAVANVAQPAGSEGDGEAGGSAFPSGDAVNAQPERTDNKSIEQRIREMGSFADFDYIKQSLNRQEMTSELAHENVQYAELVNMLEQLDLQIAHIFKDTTLTAEDRFEKIKQLGVERAAYSGMERQLLADKAASVMEAIVKAAEATVEARTEHMRAALGSVADARMFSGDQETLQQLIDSRLHVQMDLMDLSKQIIEVYMAMDRSVSDLKDAIADERSYSNDYINNVMQPLQPIFVPQNIGAVAAKLIGDLQRNRVALSVVEDKIKGLINLVFKLCEEDAMIIEYQQKLIRLLQAQRVEDIVIVDSVIKNALRLFIGAPDTGRTATAVTWSGIVSRRQNTLLLDLSGGGKLRHYDLEPVPLDEFLGSRIERPLLCVEGALDGNPELIGQTVSELKKRLNYYACIHVLLDARQTDLIERLASSALSVHFITDCTPRGNDAAKQAIAAFTEDNIATKVIVIDPPVDPMRMLSELSVDPMLVKLIVIPRLQHIRACALNRARPYDSREVMEVYEEAFR